LAAGVDPSEQRQKDKAVARLNADLRDDVTGRSQEPEKS